MDPARPRFRVPAHAVRERDAALRRMGRARGAAIAASAGLSAAFAGLVASSPPGSKASVAPRVRYTPVASRQGASTPSVQAAAPALPPLAGASALGLQAPAQAPDAASGANGSSSSESSSSSAAQGAPSTSAQVSPSPPASSSAAAAAPSAPAPAASQAAAAPAPAPAPQPGPVVSGGS